MLYTLIIQRPYVFLFLLSYLIISWKLRGSKNTIIFLITGYLIALASEASSIRNGFPYGWYFYLYENMPGEQMVFGVPFWDSLSYPFLCFAGYIVSSCILNKNSFSLLNFSSNKQNTKDWFTITFLSGSLTTLLDIVIDPVAHLGDQWFLGKIYYYPNPGLYFDIPISNFLGWFLVSSLIVGFNLKISHHFNPPKLHFKRIWVLAGIGLYYGIFLFNWIIAIYLQQYLLAFLDLIWIFIPSLLLYRCYLKETQMIKLEK